ncbi:SOS response-associated peptidase [Roseisolibacter sp. H3M3-2]|uniref:SOS response-associated peptidase n=1 Tax=Roseisolibacter sp. H3M3-2 TaxID=3031323 RepID=UPI0023DA8B54|nr:SOS response-associated peptidase [Roseisolibacter sp. H3M3-2]MDF1503198.1 SOS response-associated peptidase [Roseisolibacter sp. H3M3-2]
MCGRFGLIRPELLAERGLLDALAVEEVGASVPPTIAPRFNVAPGTDVLVALAHRRDGVVRRRLDLARWGLAARRPGRSERLVNARSESVAGSPATRDAWARGRRCLVPADVFYEWQDVADGDDPTGGARRTRRGRLPWAFARGDDAPFAFGGVWDASRDPDAPEAPPVVTFAVLTTAPNALLATVHDRMPVIVPPAAFDAWLDRATPPAAAAALLGPYPAAEMRGWRISTRVNDPRHDDASVLEPV